MLPTPFLFLLPALLCNVFLFNCAYVDVYYFVLLSGTAPYSDKSDANIAKRMLKLSRAELAKAISIITGFNRLSYMQFKADPAIDPTCRLCGEGNETFWHLVTECPRLNSTRQKFFLDNTPKKDEWKISKLISFSDTQLYKTCSVMNRSTTHNQYMKLITFSLMTVTLATVSYDIGLI